MSLVVFIGVVAGCRSIESTSSAATPSAFAGDATVSGWTGTSASERLQLESILQSGPSSATPPADLAPPPGVDPQTLARSDSPQSRLDLAAALAEIGATTELELPREAVEVPPADEDAAAAALSLYLKGRQAALDGKPLVAVTELRKATELDPASVPIKRELARAYLTLNGMPAAVGLFVQILQMEPDDPEALLTLALLSADRRDFEQAAAILARAWELPPRPEGRFWHDSGGDVLAHHVLSEAMLQLGFDRAAMEAAGEAAAVQLGTGVMYARRLGGVYRQRSELWRIIGDGHCRLGEYEPALDAYQRATSLPTPDPGGLTARVVYANLCLGRVRTAQLALLDALRDDPDRVGDREIGLCRYVAEHAGPIDELAASVMTLYEDHRDQPNLARAAASLQPQPRSTDLLREFLGRRPRDTTVVTQLLRWLSDEDPAAAAALAIELLRDHPDLAEENVRRLIVSGPRVTEMLRAAQTLPPSAARANFEARLLAMVEALGRAWSVAQEAIQKWPEDPTLLVLQLDLAGMLGERDLIESSLRAARDVPGHGAWIARSRVLGGLGDADASVEAAQRAVAAGEHRTDALMALARAQFLLASQTTNELEQRRHAQAAAESAEQVIAIDPTRDGAHEVLVNLYRSNSILADAGELGRVAERLRESNPSSRLLSLLVAQDMINQGRLDAALDRILTIYEADPTDGVSLSLAIAIWSQTQRLDDALAWLVVQRRERPGDPLLLEQWTRLELDRGNLEETMRAIRTEVQVDSANDVARRMLESCLLALDRVDEAVEIGRARLLERPRGVARELGLANMFGRVDMNDAALTHLQWILDEGGAADVDDLLSALTITIELDTDDQRRSDLLLGLSERIIDERQDAPMRVYGTAMLVLAERGALDDRFDLLARRAVEQAPGGSDASARGALLWQRVAQTLVSSGQPAAAARALRARLYAVAPMDAEARTIMTVMTMTADAAAGGEVEKTVGLLLDLDSRGELAPLQEDPELPPLAAMFYEASQIYSIVGDEEGAARLLGEVLARKGDHAMALNNLGYLRLVGDDAAANAEQIADWIELAYSLNPTDANILDTVGWLRYKQGRLAATPADDDPSGGPEPAAIELIEAAVTASEDPSAELYDHLGDVLYRLGRADDAVAAWRRAKRRLEDATRRQETLQQYAIIQGRLWQLVVADPEELWQRDYGTILERVRAKLEAVASDGEPELASQFPSGE